MESEHFTFHILDWKAWKETRSADGRFTGAGVQLDAGKSEDILTVLREKDAEILRLEQESAADKARIAELEKELAVAGATPTTTVNAAKWGNSVTAAFEVWSEIIQGTKTSWKESEFRALIATRCPDYHTEVFATAWSLLPGSFKHGRGRPKKNPEKS